MSISQLHSIKESQDQPVSSKRLKDVNKGQNVIWMLPGPNKGTNLTYVLFIFLPVGMK